MSDHTTKAVYVLYGEHVFGVVNYNKHQSFRKFDCYSDDLNAGSSNPDDPSATTPIMKGFWESED